MFMVAALVAVVIVFVVAVVVVFAVANFIIVSTVVSVVFVMYAHLDI